MGRRSVHEQGVDDHPAMGSKRFPQSSTLFLVLLDNRPSRLAVLLPDITPHSPPYFLSSSTAAPGASLSSTLLTYSFDSFPASISPSFSARLFSYAFSLALARL